MNATQMASEPKRPNASDAAMVSNQGYTATIDHGQGGQTTIAAATITDALALAKEWAVNGEWKEDGEVTVELWNGEPRPHEMPDAEAVVAVRATNP